MYNIIEIANIIKLASLENLWPTRCCVCDKPGHLLCKSCESKLPFIDQYSSCQKCGEPYGLTQCCGCTKEHSSTHGRTSSIKQCRSAVILNADTGRITTIYKDAGEQRLSKVLAYFMSIICPNEWLKHKCFVTWIPSTKEAVLRRGFDHCKNVCNEFASMKSLNAVSIFDNPKSVDQRKLNRKQRIENMSNILKVKLNTVKKITNYFDSVIVIDDVYTTGSTLNAAANVLKKCGFKNIYCITFARTF